MKDWKELPCPVPPWNHIKIRLLAQYLDVSLAKLASSIGISKETIYGWTRRKSSEFETKSLKALATFRKKIPALRKAAIEARQKKIQDEGTRRKTSKTPLKVARILNLVNCWGWSMVEFAVFSGVSYDTISSWRAGRRALRFVDKIEILTTAEKVAQKRAFKKNAEPTALQDFAHSHYGPSQLMRLPSQFKGKFQALAQEKIPGVCAKADKGDLLEIQQSSGKPPKSKVLLTLKKKKITFHGNWAKLRISGKDYPVLELFDPEGKSQPLQEKAGCVIFRHRSVTLSLWSKGNLPVRILGGLLKEKRT